MELFVSVSVLFEVEIYWCILYLFLGLGRGPVMVAVALIELGYSYEDAVEVVREKRRGAINAKQLEYLSRYKPKSRLTNDRRKSCSIQWTKMSSCSGDDVMELIELFVFSLLLQRIQVKLERRKIG